MMPTSLAAVVTPRTFKIIKTGLLFLKEEKICYTMVYYTVCLSKANQLSHQKSDFLEGALALKELRVS